jgi:hypothetical protein
MAGLEGRAVVNAPLRDPAPIGSNEELRQFAADKFALVELYAGHAVDLALAGDDEGLTTTTVKAISALFAAVATVQDLRGRGDQC